MAKGRAWTGKRIIAAIQAWAERTGEPPTANDWRDWSPLRHPHPRTARVIAVFGSWSEAMEAAGFPPRRQGNQPSTRRR